MLSIALGAMIIACLLLTLLFRQYDFSPKISARVEPARALVTAVAEKIPTVHL